MRNATLLLTTLTMTLALAGCSKNPKDRLQGKWLGDSITNVAAEQTPEATAWVKGTAVEFSGDKMTITVPAEQPRTAEFKVAKADGKKVSLAITREGGAAETAQFAFGEDNSLRMDVGEGREMVLTRLK